MFTNPADILILLLMGTFSILSAFFSGSETAFFTLSNSDLKRLENGRTLMDRAASQLNQELRQLLITILMGNMVINVGYFAMATLLVTHLEKSGQAGALLLALFGFIPLLWLVLLGELLPKLLASRYNILWARLAAPILLSLHRLIAPLRIGLNQLILLPLSRLVIGSKKVSEIEQDELEQLLSNSQRHGVIDDNQEQLLQNVLTLSSLKVKDIMTPRVDVVAHAIGESPEDLTGKFMATKLANMPVFGKNLDDILGMAHARQVLLKRPQTRQEVEQLTREAHYVPEIQRVDQLLVELRRRGIRVAIAVDEYGGTAGLVSLEDVVEQMVGEITGPYDPAQEPEIHILKDDMGKTFWRVRGDLRTHEMAEHFTSLRHLHGSRLTLQKTTTLAGWIMAQLGRLPVDGETVTFANLTFIVNSINNRRIDWIDIHLDPNRKSSQAASKPTLANTGKETS